MKKAIRVLFLLLIPISLLLSQNLAEVSKKERERRDKLKGKNVKVITNDDLRTVKKRPAITTATTPPEEEAESEAQATDLASAQAAESVPAEGAGPLFATAILPDTILVENPEFALDAPDGQFAEIPFGGFLDLELNATNGPGNDIVIYANRSGSEGGAAVEEGMPLGAEQLALPAALQYGVLVADNSGEWVAIGQGMGLSSREAFDLVYIPSITRIRIVFRAYGNASADVRADYYSLTPRGLSMGIDAVEALH